MSIYQTTEERRAAIVAIRDIICWTTVSVALVVILGPWGGMWQ